MGWSFLRYLEFLNRVIEWNKVVHGDNVVPESLQKSITREEINETIKAIEDDDVQEILDGIGDILVTAGYLTYMNTGANELIDTVDVPEIRFSNPLDILNEMLIYLDLEVSDITYDYHIQALICWACKKYGYKEVEKYIENILISNESKFMLPRECDTIHEVSVAVEKYKSKGFKNIVIVTGEFMGKEVYILRADGGNGKVLKPTTFVEPSDIDS